MLAAARNRLRAWWLSRTPPSERWTLTQRNVYILPTRAGLAFGLMLLLLLLASINYQLNLGYALTFLLAGSALASMHMTHGSLRGLSLHLRPLSPTFAGTAAALELVVTNPDAARHGLGFRLEGALGQTAPGDSLAWGEVAAASQTTITVAWTCAARGHRSLPAIRVESRFPFGLFQAWSVWRPAGRLWVYPAPEHPAAKLPPARALPGEGRPSRPSPSGEFDGVRPWRRGDGPRTLVWKKVARTGEMISRDARESADRQCWLDWDDARLREPEARLSRLTAWVLAADASGRAWGLRLPGQEWPPNAGAQHRHTALRALAAWSR